MKKVIILRGLPGASKSTLAKQIVGLIEQSTCVCSTDDFFVNPVTQKYEFNPKLLGINHAKNFDKFCQALQNHIEVIIVDNTNIKRRDFQRYVDAAKELGYEVEEIIVGGFSDQDIEVYFKRNSHGVPLEKIQQMARAFQE